MRDTGWPASVEVREVGPRDGLQIEAPISTADKIRLIDRLVTTGVRRIEATSFVSPTAVPSLADAAEVAAHVLTLPGVEWSALVAGPGGARRALAAGITHLQLVVSAADGHSLANARRSTDVALGTVAGIAASVHDAGGRCEVVVAVAWDCPFDGPTPTARAVSVVERAVDFGADAVCLADTIGTASPARVSELVAAVGRAVPHVPLGAHFHDTRGMGIANALTAVRLGVTSLDASIGGMGGCPFAPGASGNITTEELVYLLDDAGVHTGIDLEAALDAARLAQELVGHPLDSALLRAGGRSVPSGPRD